MRNLVDSQEQVLVAGSPDHIRGGEEAPGEHGALAEEKGTGDLEEDDAQNDIFGERFGTAEFCYLFLFILLAIDGSMDGE